MGGDRADRGRAGPVGAGLLTSLFVVTAILTSSSSSRSGGPGIRPTFPAESGAVSLWLSATDVRPGAELVASLQNPKGVNSTFGVAATIDRWNGAAWKPHRFVAVCLDFWSCTGKPQPLGDYPVEAIGLIASAQHSGPIERFSTAGLDPGWYRLRQEGTGHVEAAGIFQVDDAAPVAPPLPKTGGQALTIRPFLVPTAGTTVVIGVSDPGAQSLVDLRAAVSDLTDMATIEHWTGSTWADAWEATLRLDPIEPSRIDRLADIPALPQGAYRLIRHGARTSPTGPFWVTDLAGPIGPTDLHDVDWANVRYPLDCPQVDRPPFQVQQVVYATPAQGRNLALVSVTCQTEESFPPRTIFVFDSPPTLGAVRPIQTIRDEPNRVNAQIGVAGADLILSGPNYPPGAGRCCPTSTFTSRWTWTGDSYRNTQ